MPFVCFCFVFFFCGGKGGVSSTSLIVPRPPKTNPNLAYFKNRTCPHGLVMYEKQNPQFCNGFFHLCQKKTKPQFLVFHKKKISKKQQCYNQNRTFCNGFSICVKKKQNPNFWYFIKKKSQKSNNATTKIEPAHMASWCSIGEQTVATPKIDVMYPIFSFGLLIEFTRGGLWAIHMG